MEFTMKKKLATAIGGVAVVGAGGEPHRRHLLALQCRRHSLQDKSSDPVMQKNLHICLDSMGCATLAQVEAITAKGYSFGDIPAGQSRTFTVKVTLPGTGVPQNDLQNAQAKAVVEATLKSVA